MRGRSGAGAVSGVLVVRETCPHTMKRDRLTLMALWLAVVSDANSLLQRLQRSNRQVPQSLRDLFLLQHAATVGALDGRLKSNPQRYLNWIRALWTRCAKECGIKWPSLPECMAFDAGHGGGVAFAELVDDRQVCKSFTAAICDRSVGKVRGFHETRLDFPI